MGFCSAINCSNNPRKGFRVYRFPSDPKRRALWAQNMQRDWIPSKHAVLCEKHFEESQFERKRTDGRIKLKPNAIPTIFNVPNPPKRFHVSRRKSSNKSKQLAKKEDAMTKRLDCEEDSKAALEEHDVLEKVKANLCRVCGCSGGILTPILEETSLNLLHGMPFVKVLEIYLSLQVSRDDPFPLSICSKCCNTLVEWHQFYLTCVAANESFKNLFGGGKDEEASSCAVISSSVLEDTEIISNSFRKDHNYVKDELEETEKMEQDVDESEDNIDTEDFETKDKKQSCKEKIYFCKFCHHSLNENEKREQDVDESEDNINASYLYPPYFCKFCHQSFYNTIEMKNHVQLCKEEPTVCDLCGKLLQHRKLLAIHRYKKHHFYLRLCDRCGKSVPSQHYSRHCAAFHSGTYYCNLCCKVLCSKTLYNGHMRKHDKGQIKACLKIDPFLTDDGVCMYQCPICKDLFKDLPAVIMHLNEPKVIRCPTCSIKFNNEKRLAIHTCKKWECHFCKKSFFIRERFLEHERIHTGEKPYKCHFCSASFRKKYQRIVHHKSHGPPSHECKYCGKKFKLATSLRNHINAHKGVFFSCAICKRKFPEEKYLQRHIKTHDSCV